MKMQRTVVSLLIAISCIRIDAQSPEKFLQDLLTDKVEYSATLTPDKMTVYFVITDSFYVSKPKNIYKSSYKDGKWTRPQTAYFSGTGSDSSPFVSPDGKKLFFTSRRSINGVLSESSNIWYVNLEIESNPIYLNEVNSEKSEYSPSVDLEGNLYFGSYREGGYGSGDIWFSPIINGVYQKPINLGTNINSIHGEWGSCISPNGDYIIFENSGREENLSGAGDLYISFYSNNKWQPAVHFKSPINSIVSDLTPRIHGDILYFASNRDFISITNINNVDLYQIRLDELMEGVD